MRRLAIRQTGAEPPRPVECIQLGPKPELKRRKEVDPKPIARDMFDKIKKGLRLCETMQSTPVETAEGNISVLIPSVPQAIQSTPVQNVGGLMISFYAPKDTRADHRGDGRNHVYEEVDDLWQAAQSIEADFPKGVRHTDEIQHIKTVIWVLRYISSCVRLVERSLGLTDVVSSRPKKRSRHERRSQSQRRSPDEKYKKEWENLARMANRIENQAGLTCLGLPYALASELTEVLFKY